MADGVLGGNRSDRAAFCPIRALAACRRAHGRDGLGSGPQELLDHRRTPRLSHSDGLQHLLARASWDADAVRDDLRDYVIDALGDPGAILVVDETGDVKKGVRSVGVQRQYSGTAGRIENSQVAVYLTYAAPRGHALIDRALYLPRSWAEDPARCTDAGIPDGQRGFATKPTLAATLIDRAVAAKIPAAWVAGDEVYGADPRLRARVAASPGVCDGDRGQPARAHPCWPDPRRCAARADTGTRLAETLAGAGAHGPRLYSWAWFRLLAEDDTDTGVHHLLIRRNDATGEHAYLRCYSPRPVPLRTLVTVAGQRWRIEESFQAAKGLVGLDQHQVRRWNSWHRWTPAMPPMPSWPWRPRSNATPRPPRQG